ncbi:MAG TPA: hypothetical protein VF170_17635 [Planctomycetaceae bacterium]
MRTSTVAVSAAFAVFMLVVLVVVLNQDLNDLDEAPVKFAELRHAAGLFFAAAAGLFLLIRAIGGDSPGRLVSLVLPFLAGVLLIEPDWGVALALAAATAAAALRRWLAGPTRHLASTPPPHSPPVL